MNAPETSRSIEPVDDVVAMMSALLPLHAVQSGEALADAIMTAAERGLGASFAFWFRENSDGRFTYAAPASETRRRTQRRAIDALGTVLFRTPVAASDVPSLAEALDGNAVISCAVRELFAPLIDEGRGAQAEAELGATQACAAPIESAGERFGVLVLLSGAAIVPERVRLLADHAASALLNLSNEGAASGQSAADPMRAIFDPRKVEGELQRELARAQRYARDVSICVIEATNLKLLRERFGGALTDRLYERLGAALSQQARDVDIIGAYKESGYTMVLTEASASGVESAADRLLSVAANVTLEGERIPGLELHLASGRATSPEDGLTAEALFAAAERRMYGGAAERVA